MSSPGSERLAREIARAGEHAPAACDVTIVAHDIGSVRGMERQLSELVPALARLGHRVTVIARSCELPVNPNIVFHRVRGPGRPFVIAYPWFLAAGSLALRRRRRGIVQITGAIVLGRVDILTVHYCHQVATATPSRSSWLYRGHAKLAGALKRVGEKVCFAVSRPAAVVCVSEGVAQEIREHYPALTERLLTIHNGIDTASFTPHSHPDQALALRRRLGIANERLVAAFVGSEWERKGLEPLIRALPLAGDWELLVAGGGEQARFAALAESLGVGSRVHWLGVTREVHLVYELADSFVLPSRYETFSLVTFEAAASGLAVLATPVNGVRELINDGENGFLITAEPRVIAERLNQLAADPKLRGRLGKAARSSALQFGSERMIAAHHDLYTRLAAASPSRS